jgi:hypothetical protein
MSGKAYAICVHVDKLHVAVVVLFGADGRGLLQGTWAGWVVEKDVAWLICRCEQHEIL